MKEPTDILNHLRDLDFDESELRVEMDEMVEEHELAAANKTLYQHVTKVRRFKDRRDKRLDCEFDDLMIENNNLRLERKLARAQETYKSNRKAKKSKNKQIYQSLK